MINLNGKKFKLLSNSENGQVDSNTLFEYTQEENRIIAKYSDDGIVYGSIIGVVKADNKISLLYHSLMKDGMLKAGSAEVDAEIVEGGKIKLTMNWQWLIDDKSSGMSEYIEI